MDTILQMASIFQLSAKKRLELARQNIRIYKVMK